MATRSPGILLAAIALSGCAAPPPGPARAVAVGRAWSGPETRIDANEVHRIADPASWAALWTRHAGTEAGLPAVDFSKNLVIACFWERRSSPGSFGVRVTEDGRRITVALHSYVGDAYPQTPPVHLRFTIVEIPRSPLPLTVATMFRSMVQPDAFEILKEFPALR